MEPISWGTVSTKLEECTSIKEREIRSVALEKTYVHDVYQQMASHFMDTRYRAWPRVKQFLLDLDPGSIVCDVGCGNGKHLDINPYLYKVGVDRCSNLVNVARDNAHEVLISDNLALPFRDDCLDAVLSVAVVHHFATADRRVEALRELARVLRIGGKILISVWAMEQRHRKFEAQDVLIPWNRPVMSSSEDKTSSIERDLNSTTTTSDDDVTHYHAYTQTSDSDSFPSLSRDFRKRVRLRHRGKSIDPTCSSQSSSDLSSPNESCYTFVRRAIQKLAGSKRSRGGRPWFLQGLSITDQDDIIEPLASMDEDAGEEIKNAEDQFRGPTQSTHFSEFLKLGESNSMAQKSLIFSNLLSTRRRRTLETTRELQHPTPSQIYAQPKSKSLSDLLGLIPIAFFRSTQHPSPQTPQVRQEVSLIKGPSQEQNNAQSNSNLLTLDLDVEFPQCVSHKAVQTDIFESGPSFTSSLESKVNCFTGHHKVTSSGSPEPPSKTPTRPTLVKQKHSIISPIQSLDVNFDEAKEDRVHSPETTPKLLTKVEESWRDIKTSVRNLPEFRPTLPPVHPHPNPTSSVRVTLTGSSLWKQTSLNDELIFSERLREKERLKQNIQKQCSLNEEFMNKERENTRWDQMKEAFLNPSNVKCIQLLKNGISSRFLGYETPTPTPPTSRIPSPAKPVMSQTNSIRSGFVRMLQNWKQSDSTGDVGGGGGNGAQSFVSGAGCVFLGSRRGSKEGSNRRGLFPPFFLRRSSAGSLNLTKKDLNEPSSLKLLSPPPYLSRKPSENELVHDGRLGSATGNKLAPGLRHVRKLSREDGSDSSKDSSFQSDTSVDSEDSFASVIFIPKGVENGGNESCFFGSETRANSTDSDRSPKSPALRLSPPNHSSTPKSPSPLAVDMTRRRSPDVSPTRLDLFGLQNEKGSKFIFDESATQVLSILPTTTAQGATINQFESAREGVAPPQEGPPEVTLVPPPVISEGPLQTDVPSFTIRLGNEILALEEQEQSSPRKKIEKIDVLRKPVNLPKNKAEITRKLVRRSLPKALAVELYNPETDDADTSDSSSSSPNSVSSVVSVVNEESAQQRQKTEERVEEKRDDSALPEIITKEHLSPFPVDISPKNEVIPSGSGELPLKETCPPPLSSSYESLGSSSPKSKRKLTLARLGNTTDWLCSIPSDMVPHLGTLPLTSTSPSLLPKRSSSVERRHPGEKILLGEVKKFHQKGPEAKWPACIIDDSPPSTAKAKSDEEDRSSSMTPLPEQPMSTTAHIAERLLEEMEEQDSLFDSIENLASRQQPSRNPSIDSSLRMSSTCSCSIRGGDSFESYSSAKSSLTNSSSNHHKASLPSINPSMIGTRFGNLVQTSRRRRPESSLTSSAAGEDTEDSSTLTYHRYYHVFREGELDRLIEKHVQNLHIISSYYDHANWCIIAEKVQVWTI